MNYYSNIYITITITYRFISHILNVFQNQLKYCDKCTNCPNNPLLFNRNALHIHSPHYVTHSNNVTHTSNVTHSNNNTHASNVTHSSDVKYCVHD